MKRGSTGHLDRVTHLLGLQGQSALEDELVSGTTTLYIEHQTAHPGTNKTYYVIINGRLVAYHKPHSGLLARNVSGYGHTPDTPPMHECAAWRLAEALGDPFSELLVPCVYRECRGEWGSLAMEAHGGVDLALALRHGPDQVASAGLFDALIGQQDRNPANLRWDPAAQVLKLIDHGFAFPRPGDLVTNASLQQIRHRGSPELTAVERIACRRLVTDPELLGIRGILEPDRADRLRWRAEEMLQRGTILARGEI